jgi:UDP-N-acetylglucosamine/UDP-N-acetylgalactosamine 4-epimerase
MGDYNYFKLPIEIQDHIRNSSFLITGGAGFIGSNLVGCLLSLGASKVRVLDNFATGYKSNLAEFENHEAYEFIEGDIRILSNCIDACHSIDYVFHQAALGSVPRSIDDPITSNNVNIGGHLNMLLACHQTNIRRMIYAASSSTYGDSKLLPKREDNIGKPLSPYAVTKLVNELYADVFNKTYGLDTIGLRYFNVFGPKQSPSGAYAAVIPLFIDAILNDKDAFINGDGQQTRDFTYVDNVLYANILAMYTKNPKAVNQVYNVAVGEKISLNELFSNIKIISNKLSCEPIYRQERKGDVRDSLADITKAQTLLGYQPLINVHEGIKLTYEYWKAKV